MKKVIIFLLAAGLGFACGGDSKEENQADSALDSTAVGQDEPSPTEPTAEAAPPSNFSMSASDTFEDFLYIVMSERFPDDELNGYGEWQVEAKELPILFFTLAYSPEWYVLVSPNDDFEYSLQEVALPDDSPWTAYGNTTTTAVYKTGLEPVDEAGGEDFVVSTEIMGSGPAPDGDGMVMLDFIKAAVLRYKDGVVKYMPELTEGYNGYIGATEEGVSLPPMELLSIKYDELKGQVLEYPDSRRIGELLQDMSLAPNTTYGGDMELQWIAPTVEGEYVKSMSDETSYFVLDRDNEFNLGGISYDLYPVYLITSEYYTRYFTVNSATVKEAEVYLTLLELAQDFSLTEEAMDLSIVREDDRWIVESEEGSLWMPKFQAEELPMSEDY